MSTTITLSISQLLLLFVLVATLVAVVGGAIHHATGNPKSHGYFAYGLAIVVIVTFGASAMHGLDLPFRTWHSFDTADAAPARPIAPQELLAKPATSHSHSAKHHWKRF